MECLNPHLSHAHHVPRTCSSSSSSSSSSARRALRLFSFHTTSLRTKRLFPSSSFLSSPNPRNPSPLSLPVQLATSRSQSSVKPSTDIAEWAMQDFYALRKDVEATAERVDEIRISAGLEQLEADLAVLEKKSADSSLWDDPSKAQEILLALTDVKEKIKLLNDFESQVEEAKTIVNLTEESESIDAGLLEEASKIIRELNNALDRYELTQLLAGPYDKEGAVINITAGAGGTDAQVCI
ncbi:peptide chain release factor PrfB1, chloroplastic-like [Ananas comosus]|uniref:Peptide chain release factor PrfB1, chloroplastic-like n=1 Tax=Ananas comosus TaxID=4615 RepID=A0A6P5EAG9_ANACO|nr:peptide chain release factor PrfB1, chloroplastic-like [Ananas comosus]